MNNKRPGEGLHILWEVMVKAVEYRRMQWHKFFCDRDCHEWEDQPEGVDQTKCKWCPKTTWRWPKIKR